MSATPENWEKIKALFEAALELPSPERTAFLARHSSDPIVRAEVERLLCAHGQAGSFLSTPLLNISVSSTPPLQQFLVGDLVAHRFRIVRFIAAGGMGEVYEAEDLELRERVAIKTILADALHDPKAKSRFKREVQLARRITHPNVCRLFDMFRHDNVKNRGKETLVVSMELLNGKTLAQSLKKHGCIESQFAAPLLRQLASGLIAAHDLGIVHGDLKPSNIILVDSSTSSVTTRLVITDFGLASRFLDFDGSSSTTLTTLSTEQGLLGTPAYMAPEQIQGQHATVASDIYAVGLVLYEMLTAVHPFAQYRFPQLMSAIVTKQPQPPRSVNPRISKEMNDVVLKALEKEPVDRYESVRVLMDDLERLSSEANSASIQPRRLERTVDLPRLQIRKTRNSLAARLAIGVLSVLLLGVGSRFAYDRFLVPKQFQRGTQPARSVLSYYVIARGFQRGKPTGEPYQVSEQQIFTSGTGIYFVFNSPEPGYLYLVNEGSASDETSPALNVLFPSPTTNAGSAQLVPGSTLTFPEGNPLVFDNQRGTEKVWFVWSRRSIEELELLKKWANLEDRGRVGDLAQARSVKSFLERGTSFSPPEVSRDAMNHIKLTGAGDTFVYLLKLDHR